MAWMESVRLLLALAATKDCRVHHMDVKFAFLNSDLSEIVFVKQASGFIANRQEHKVLRLCKAIYKLQ